MEFDRDTKQMIATVALVGAFAVGMNYLVVADANESFMGWSIGLFVVAVLFWIWMRRDDLAANRKDAIQAADEAARRAEELAKKAQDKASAELDQAKEKIEVLAEDVHDYTDEMAEAVKDAADDVDDTVENITETVADDVEQAADEVAEIVSDEPDDLSKIEGIGPVYQGLLKDAGITTFAAIANASQEDLEKIISDAGKRRPASIETWSEQASYAAKGDWDGLQKLQDKLDGGRRV